MNNTEWKSQYVNADCMCPERGLPSLPSGSVNLLIVDPPYFETKGAFDWKWASFGSYLRDVKRWAEECRRVLALNGTMYWFGCAKKIAYTQVILDKRFALLNSARWEKPNALSRVNSVMRVFAPVTEACLVYEQKDTDLRKYFSALHAATGQSKAALVASIGQRVDHCLRYGSSQFSLCTEDTYTDLLRFVSPNGFPSLPYSSLRRYFNNPGRLSDIWEFAQNTSIYKKYDHPTQKAPRLIRTLIEVSSPVGAIVCAPFGGAGVDGEQAVYTGRKFIGYEIDEGDYETCRARLDAAIAAVLGRSMRDVWPGTQISLLDRP